MSMLSSILWRQNLIMGFVCKGFCDDFRGEKIPNGSKYEYGQKRCTFCGIFMTVDSCRCPCCSSILRTKARSKR